MKSSPFEATARSIPLFAVVLITICAVLPLQAQTFTSLYSFPGGAQGALPVNFIVGPTGTIFGVAQQGNNSNCSPTNTCGVVYSLNSSGVETVLHSFAGSAKNDGSEPTGLALENSTHTLYGVASGGGTASSTCVGGCGTVFKIVGRKETTLHAFTSSPDGNLPLGTPILDAQGNLYGVTFYGGVNGGLAGEGTVFKVDSAGNESILFAFPASGADGTNPNGSLVRDASGNLYGSTTYGGRGNCNNGFLPGCGVVFKLDSSGNVTVLHDFTGVQDGQYPKSLALDAAGNLYGLSGYNGTGVLFKIDTAGTFTVLESGSTPASMNTIILGPNGSFFATANGGDSSCTGGCGRVLQLVPNGTSYDLVQLHAFDGTDGDEPVPLTVKNGTLYGTTFMGGSANLGTVYQLVP
jgi:uncharacterized repeat protein (TIGR03803 family)